MSNPATPTKATPSTPTKNSDKVVNGRSNGQEGIPAHRTFNFYRENAYLLKVPTILRYSSNKERWRPLERILREYIEVQKDSFESMTFSPDDINRMEQLLYGILSDRDKEIVRGNIERKGRDYAVKESFFVEVRRAVEYSFREFQKEWRAVRSHEDFGNEQEYQAWILGLIHPSEKEKRKRYSRGDS